MQKYSTRRLTLLNEQIRVMTATDFRLQGTTRTRWVTIIRSTSRTAPKEDSGRKTTWNRRNSECSPASFTIRTVIRSPRRVSRVIIIIIGVLSRDGIRRRDVFIGTEGRTFPNEVENIYDRRRLYPADYPNNSSTVYTSTLGVVDFPDVSNVREPIAVDNYANRLLGLSRRIGPCRFREFEKQKYS